MIPQQPTSTSTDTLIPSTTLFRSDRRRRRRRPDHGYRRRGAIDGRPLDRPVGRQISNRRAAQVQRQADPRRGRPDRRSEEHTSELQSLMCNSYAVFCLKKKTYIIKKIICTLMTATLHIINLS